jgi:hypothetical protein
MTPLCRHIKHFNTNCKKLLNDKAKGKRQRAERNTTTAHIATENKSRQPFTRSPAFAIYIDCSKFARPSLPSAFCPLPFAVCRLPSAVCQLLLSILIAQSLRGHLCLLPFALCPLLKSRPFILHRPVNFFF